MNIRSTVMCIRNLKYKNLSLFLFQSIGLIFAFSIIVSIAMAQLCAILLLVLAIILLIEKKHFYSTSLDVPLLLFVCARLLSTIFAEYPQYSISTIQREIPFYFLYFALVQLFSYSSNTFRKLFICTLLVGGVIAASYGIIIYILGITERAHSTTSGYYTLGSYLTALLAYVLVVGPRGSTRGHQMLWSSLVLLYAIAIATTLNRIHWGITALIFVILGIMRYRTLLAFAIIGAIAMYIILPSVQQRVEQTIHFTSHLSDRDILWAEGLTKAFDHPLIGYGPNSFQSVFQNYGNLQDKKVGGWHNEYLRLQIESGIIGLITFIGVIVSIVLHAFRVKKAVDIIQRKEILGIVVAFGTIVLSSMTGSALFDILIMLLWISFCSLLFTVKRQYHHTPNGLSQS